VSGTSIAEHGLIGDLHTAALVTADGSVDWFCCPRFDSPSVFGALLDPDGGHFRIHPVGECRARQMYFPETAVLITRFSTEAGVGEVVDFMPPAGGRATDTHRLVRMVRCVRGEVHFAVDLAPRFDYGRAPHTTRVTEHGLVLTGAGVTLTLHPVREPEDPRRLTDARVDDRGDLHAAIHLSAGEVRGVVLESGAGGPPREVRLAEVTRLFEDTVAYWRGWQARSAYTGRWRETVERSAITLKLMTYAPTGGLVAAPTTGLPEQVGGERNWDYRYTWVRDAALAVSALLRLGHREEAVGFALWIRERLAEQGGDDGDRLRVVYRVDGSSDLEEEELGHWAGYRDSRPVRIGNDASGQLQLDVYGEAMDSLYLGERCGLPIGHGGWQEIRALLGWLAANWDQPEEGIWETRGGRKHFTYGRVMTWVAFDRAVRLATAAGRPADLAGWTAARDAVYEQVHDRGWSRSRSAFVQHYDDQVLDSALLRMPAVGFVTPYDPRWTSTLRAVEDELVSDSLVHRYDPQASPDGLAGSEGTFSLCSFLYVDALARSGRLVDARFAFEKMLTHASPLGLYSEEIDATGEQIGNFPQAFTHLALVEAALTLDEALDGRGATGWSR
jgi:GH15 family glucan-1,4-alpha-glucosidase